MVRVVPTRCPGTPMDHQVPRVPLRASGVTFSAAPSDGASASVTSPSSLLRTHASDRIPPTLFGDWPYRVGLCRLLPAPAARRPFPTLSPRVFPWMLRPMPRWDVKVHIPVTSFHDNGLPYGITGRLTHKNPLSNFRAGKLYEAAVISLCFGLQVCLPSRLLPPLRCRRAAMAFTFEQNVCRYLHTHRIC